MKEIGGYFELELLKMNNMPHCDGILLNSGRNALEFVLSTIKKIDKLYIPYFTCDTILEPITKLNINYEFYYINSDLEIKDDILLADDEYIIYTNYFGIKDLYVDFLDNKYGVQLIVDNAQALYCRATTKSVYSPRKFVGVADGGIALVDKINDDLTQALDYDFSYDRMSHLLKRCDSGASAGYVDFRQNSEKLRNQPIRLMSKLTKKILLSVDFDFIKAKRTTNFNLLHSKLKHINKLNIESLSSFVCPMVYPYYTDDEELRSRLIDNKIFVATYWPNVLEWCKDQDGIEYDLAKKIIPLPIDQRYSEKEMNQIILEIIKWK